MKVNTMSIATKSIAACAIFVTALSFLATTVYAETKAKTKTSSRTRLNTKANQMATGIVAAETAMTPDQITLAERVQVGRVQCELGNSVTLTADQKSPGYFDVTTGKQNFRMIPVATTTGAIRLEDKKTGGVWLQLANKSMLLNEKVGQRLADDCISPAQLAVAEAMKANPPVSVLDAPKK